MMQVRLPGRRTIVAHAFPSSDRDFAAAVSTALDQERERTTDAEELRAAVTAAVRHAYPNARIVLQADLGRLLPTEETWYAFRDAAVRTPSEQREQLYATLSAARRTLVSSQRVLEDSRRVAEQAGYASDDRVSGTPPAEEG